MKKSVLHIILFSLIVFLPSILFSGGSEYLDNIAIKCVNRKLTEKEALLFNDSINPTYLDTLTLKNKYINYIIHEPDFIEQVILFMRFRILKGTPSGKIVKQIEEFDVLSLMLPLAMEDEEEKKMYANESARLYKVYLLGSDSLSKTTYEDIYRCLFNNFIYDNQNMGEDNFINSTFQYSLGRSPSKEELIRSKEMLNNKESTLFYKKGASKDAYLNILTSNNNFYEYQVKYWYYYFLLNYPDNKKVYEILNAIRNSGNKINIENIIKNILTYQI